jgi:hypothetical protein
VDRTADSAVWPETARGLPGPLLAWPECDSHEKGVDSARTRLAGSGRGPESRLSPQVPSP